MLKLALCSLYILSESSRPPVTPVRWRVLNHLLWYSVSCTRVLFSSLFCCYVGPVAQFLRCQGCGRILVLLRCYPWQSSAVITKCYINYILWYIRFHTSHNVLSPSISAACACAKRRRFRGRSMELWKLHFPQPPRPAPLRTVRNAAQHLSLPAVSAANLPGGPWTSFFQLIFFQPPVIPGRLSSVPSASPSNNWAVPHSKRDADPI